MKRSKQELLELHNEIQNAIARNQDRIIALDRQIYDLHMSNGALNEQLVKVAKEYGTK